MFKKFDAAVSRLSRVFVILAGVAMLAIAFIVMLEVVMRSLRTPLIGGIEMTRIAFVFSVFLAFAYVTTSGREIRVDAFRHKMSAPFVMMSDCLAGLATALFFVLIFWLGVGKMVEAWEREIFLEGELLLPMWLPWGALVVGSFLATLAALCTAVRSLLEPPKAQDGISAATLQVS